jgi:hypothetical protein
MMRRTFARMTPPGLAASVFVAALAIAVTAGGAHAASYTWDTTAGATNGSGGSLGFTNNGQTLSALGYQIIGGTTAATKMNDALGTATAVEYTGAGYGIGVTDSSENGSSPGHTVSNEGTSGGKQVTDMVVFALPGAGYTPTSITLNQFCTNGNASGASSCANIGSSGSANVSIFIGNTAPTVGMTLAQLVSTGGYTQVTAANLAAGSSLTGSGNRTITLNGTLSGAYLIVVASLNDNATSGATTDYFKVASISATSPAPTPVPEPGTLAILAVGLTGLVLVRRRERQRDAA